MKNKILAITRKSIPYIPELNDITGSIAGSILMQQLDYWFEKYPDGFYKFLEPCANEAYKESESWTEELRITKEEFRTAFDKIAIRYSSKGEFSKKEDAFQGKLYCSYHDKIKGLTFYYRNHELVDSLLEKLIKPDLRKGEKKQKPSGFKSTEVVKPDLRKSGIPIYVNGDSQSLYKETEITTEITAESNNTREEIFENENSNSANAEELIEANPKEEGKNSEPALELESQKILTLAEFFTLEPNQKIRNAIFELFDIGNDFEHNLYHRNVNHFLHRLHELDVGGIAPGILERFKAQFRAYYKYILGDESRHYAGKGKKFRYTLDNFIGYSWQTSDFEKLKGGFDDGQWHVKDWYEVLKSEIDYANKNLVNT